MLEDLEVTLGDQIQKINKMNWAAAWDEAAATCVEMEDTYSLSSMNTLEEAVKNIVQFLGLQPAERSDKVPEGKSTHTLLLAGKSFLRRSEFRRNRSRLCFRHVQRRN
jgi:coatomer protein complex subunit gamma